MTVFRSIVAVVVGVVLGSLINMALIMVSGHVIPPSADADMTTADDPLTTGQAIIRYLAYFIATIPLCLGLI